MTGLSRQAILMRSAPRPLVRPLCRSMRILVAVAALVLSASDDGSAQSDDAGPFSKGSVRASVLIGSGSINETDDYTIVGIGGGYFVIDGLEAGVDANAWLGGELDIYQVSPRVGFVFFSAPTVKPYVGLFYRRTFVQQLDDRDAVGARAGVYLVSARNHYVGIGAAHEEYVGCNRSVYADCSDTSVELTVAFAF